MMLCLDVGNSHIFGGVFSGKELMLKFRYASRLDVTSDQLGLFLRGVLAENDLTFQDIKEISIASVVPDLEYSLRSACVKYFHVEPLFLKAGIKTGVKIKVVNPLEVGADMIAGIAAAIDQIPNKDLLVIDFGTATTFCAVTKEKEYIGGAITAGLKTTMQALAGAAAKLSAVGIKKPDSAIGKTTESNLQSGIYFGQMGLIKELVAKMSEEAFGGQQPTIVATGGFAQLFSEAGLFDVIVPDLVLQGLRIISEKNL